MEIAIYYIICGVIGFLCGRAYQAIKTLPGQDLTIPDRKGEM